MDPNANRSRGGRAPGAGAYGRRRFFTLLAGLGVVGLLAWACSGVASGGNSPSASVRVTKPASASSHAHPAQAANGPTACPAHDLVLTLVASRASYGPQGTPAFQIDIVSTGTATCTLDTGPEGLKLAIRHGAAVAYDSAACLQGAQRHVISLRRGVPVVTSMTWDKHQTVTGCSATVMAAANRTYSAVAQAGKAQSPAVSFRLTGAAATAQTQRPAAAPAQQTAARQP